MRKILLVTLAAALLLGCLSGCGQSPETKQPGEEIPAEATVFEPETLVISREVELEGKTLTIDAEAELPDLTRLEKITLHFDEDSFQAAGKDLVLSQYPHLTEGRSPDGYRGWSEETPERLLISFHGEDEGFRAGWCYYVDVLRDLNGQDMPGDEGRFLEPDYLTENIPNKLGMTSREAAEKIAGELEKYSCFTYEPRTVTACNLREKPESSGYYSAYMQPHFEGRPVCGKGPLRVSAHLSAEGLFAFQGIVLLKETGREPVDCGMDLNAAVARFQEDFVEQANEGAQVFVERIEAGYRAMSEYDGTWTLSPVWLFECREVREGSTRYYTSAYKMENGAFFIL